MKIPRIPIVLPCDKVVWLLCSFLLVCFCALIPPKVAFADNHLRVLVLNSYHRGFEWSDAEMAGIEAWFKTSGLQPQLYFEYMDSKRRGYERAATQASSILSEKYYRDFFDVIIAADDNAFDFMTEFRQALFPDVPLVFCGVNRLQVSRDQMLQNTTGVLELTDIAGTISLAISVQPQIRNIAFVTDNTTSGMRMLQVARNAQQQFAGRLGFIELANLSPERLKDALGKLPSSSVVILLSYLRGKDGKTLTVEEGSRMVVGASPVPVYGVASQYIASGLVGGMTLSGFEHGKHAARLAELILRGAAADSLPINTETPTMGTLDYAQLQQFGVQLGGLPEDVLVRNLPDKKFPVWGYLIIVLCVLAIGAGVVFLLRRWQCRQACREVVTAGTGALAVMQVMKAIVLLLDDNGRVIAMNNVAEDASGFDTAAANGLIPEAVFPMLAGPLEKARSALQEGADHFSQLTTARMHNGVRKIDISGSKFSYAAGGSLLVLRDVTDDVAFEVVSANLHRLSLLTRHITGLCQGAKEPLTSMAQGADELKEVFRADSEINLRTAARAGCSMDALQTYMVVRGVPRRLEALREAAMEVMGVVARMPNTERRRPGRAMPLKDVVENALRLGKEDPRLREAGISRVGWRLESDKTQVMHVIRSGDAELVVYEMIALGLQALAEGAASPGGIRIRHGADAAGGYVTLTASGCTKPVDVERLLRSEIVPLRKDEDPEGHEGFALAMFIAERRFGAPLNVTAFQDGLRIEFLLRQSGGVAA
ncbi:ABC transporter substrate binding protein [Oleidesulfovibrio sp.]|uniref:ABC transporter substrate binding protein n=1 Tax=Oleidesulfovibrio sp. TaxID=2909707 RepID=UPI003A870138